MNLNKNIKINVLLFYFCYVIILAATMFRQVNIIGDMLQPFYQICIYILLFICLLNIKNVSKKNLLILILIVFLVFVTKYITKTNTVLIMCLMIIAFKDIDFDKMVKFDMSLKIPFLIIISSLYFLDFTAVNLHYRNGVVRHSMGFSNPNVFSTYIMSIIIEYLYLRRKKINWKDFIMIFLAIFIIDSYANSRTQIFCIILLSITLFFNKYAKKIFLDNGIINFFLKNCFIILAIFSILLIPLYKNKNAFANSVNEITSGRVTTASIIYDMYGVNLFGHRLKLVTSLESKLTGKEQVALDNVYIYSLLSYGIISFIILCWFTRKYMDYAIKNKEDIIKIIMLIFFIGGLMERFCIEISFNIFLLYFSKMFYKNIEKNNQLIDLNHDMEVIK